MSAPITVVIVDDEPIIRDTLAELVATDAALELVAVASGVTEALDLTHRHRPDVLVTDVRMPDGGGRRVAREVGAVSPRTRVLAVSAYSDRGAVMEMVAAGASGYVVKGAGADDVLRAIHRTAAGQVDLDDEVTADVIDELATRLDREEREAERLSNVTRRVRTALEPGAISPVYQPIRELSSGSVVGHEALARFAGDSTRTPDVWFAEAAEVELQAELEVAAIRAALPALDAVPDDHFVSVNVSPATLVRADVAAELSRWPLPRLVLEVTEHAPVDDYEWLESALTPLREDGARLAVDDAGAGFASLRHILRLEPELIKLDVSLSCGIDEAVPQRALARALISFAEEIGAVIIAEGVEHEADLHALLELDVPYGQGWLLDRPSALNERTRSPR